MRLKRSLLVIGFALGLLLPGTSAATSNGLHLRPTAGASFPDRAYVLSLPANAYLTPDSVAVRENGTVMKGVSVVPASAATSGQFGVVLVIDASWSMRGPAIESAFAAARAFADHRQPAQALGVVTFNSRPRVLLPLSTDSEAIRQALAKPPQLEPQTHVYDAVSVAVSMLQAAKVAARSVVVLSDGADTGSAHSLDEVAAAARMAGVRVFSVGLRSHVFDAVALQSLARRGGGQYAQAATPADLEPIFDGLGSTLASEYLIRYRSSASADQKVVVAVTVKGYPGAVTAGYATPGLASETSGEFNRSAVERYVRSSAGMVLTALFVALLAAGALHVLIRPRQRGVKRRLADFVRLSDLGEKPTVQERKELLFERAERSFSGARWWIRFQEDLDVARIRIPAIQIVVWTAAATVIAVYLLALISGTLGALLGLVVPLVVRAVIRRKVERERQLFAEQLPDNLQVLASALRAGHSLVGALSVVVEDSPEPSKREFGRLVADEQLGVPLEDAFELVARRMDSKDLRQVGLVAALQHETGGNTAEVLDRVAETVRERFELRRLVRTLTAQGRMSRWILTGLPIFLLAFLTLVNPVYISPLYEHGAGRAVLIGAAVMVTAGSLLIRRIINIKV